MESGRDYNCLKCFRASFLGYHIYSSLYRRSLSSNQNNTDAGATVGHMEHIHAQHFTTLVIKTTVQHPRALVDALLRAGTQLDSFINTRSPPLVPGHLEQGNRSNTRRQQPNHLLQMPYLIPMPRYSEATSIPRYESVMAPLLFSR